MAKVDRNYLFKVISNNVNNVKQYYKIYEYYNGDDLVLVLGFIE